MQLQMSGQGGFRFRSIIVHSLWITIIGIFLFRLATANTQEVIYIQIFSISGVVLATSPWIIQLLVSTAIIFLYRTKCYDLTWLLRLPSEEGSCCQGSRAVDEGSSTQVWVINGNAQGIVDGHEETKVINGLGMQLHIDGRSGPRLQRSRTV
ncbi:uncharacterized protein LOC111286709 [Durio zibethinus]|uniref:Uncharacterized protein LOC111286709 n=1 Tax=Durio zibethinus TaxID=66656 RepID=A0A6P5XWJ9_DURZI|nr:uncharacterized protein LOC111286709 [Durio zibethinus]